MPESENDEGPTPDPDDQASQPASSSEGSTTDQPATDPTDLFYLTDVYPDAAAIFTFRPKSIDEIKDNCDIVIDTNALLIPYGVGSKKLDEIKAKLKALIVQGRLFIPGQVAREFAKHRAAKLSDLHYAFSEKSKRAQGVDLGDYKLLVEFAGYQEAGDLVSPLNKQISEYKGKIDAVVRHIEEWNWNDPVSMMYGSLFDSKVVQDPPLDREVLSADFVRRKLHKIPPGYEDNSVGDLVIWHTILSIAGNRKRDMLFVSHDEKPDWRLQSGKKALYPRYELVDEYRRHSDGHTFQIVRLSKLLSLYGASKATVEEVAEEEARTITIQLPEGDWPWIPGKAMASDAVANWVRSQEPEVRSAFRPAADPSLVEIRRTDDTVIRVYTAVVLAPDDMEQVARLLKRAKEEMEAGLSSTFVVGAVAISDMEASRHAQRFIGLQFDLPKGCQMVLGYLDGNQVFIAKMRQRHTDEGQITSI